MRVVAFCYFCDMKVTTLNDEAFAEACRRLEERTRSFGPDLVVGIATGGELVAGRMFASVPHVSVESRRPTTAAKERCGGVWRLVRRLPLWMRNSLRIAEARMLSAGKPRQVEAAELAPDAVAAIAGARRVLIVDDAIDSGATMARVLEAVRGVGGERQTATAVINVTTKKHLVEPDYRLYVDRRLVRYPWSKDFRE